VPRSPRCKGDFGSRSGQAQPTQQLDNGGLLRQKAVTARILIDLCKFETFSQQQNAHPAVAVISLPSAFFFLMPLKDSCSIQRATVSCQQLDGGCGGGAAVKAESQ